MDRNREIELIILDVLGCQDKNDKKDIQVLKANHKLFSWRDLAKYQNLVARLPSLLVTENASAETKDIMVKRLNRLIFGKADIGQTEKFVPGKKSVKYERPEKVDSQNNIDWESFSDDSSSSKKLQGFEEVKTKSTSRKEETINFSNILGDDNESVEFVRNSIPESGKKHKGSSTLKKYILVSILLFVVIVSLSVYMVFNNNAPVEQFVEEVKQADTTAIATLEELIDDSLTVIEPTLETVEIQKVQNPDVKKSEQKVEQNTLPKAPPKLPELIDAPIIAANEVENNKETFVVEEISNPPTKETIDEVEEPTFFVAVEEMPQPIGGLQSIMEKIKYPEIAKRAGVEGKVFVRAFVDENGNVVNAEIVKGIGAGCDEAALDAVIKTKFTPGKQRGKPIKVQITVPIHFKL